MRKFLLISILSVFVSFQAASEGSASNTCNVVLKGIISITTPTIRTTPGTPPVVATLDGYSLFVEFKQTLGILNVTVTDHEDNIMFDQTVDATAGSSLLIDVESWRAGEYTLLITNELEESLEGTFVIEEEEED